ncbi:hypothetical protein Dac01nite_12940 [Demequina activiva]|uniref:Uncharacterized protein n=1 Tax=Demequina activiva TaxID=1582364 RepID=A0A919Q3H0_9MICO|nr:hypothetical protein Dac01nite_12940 [Demequina activiva]
MQAGRSKALDAGSTSNVEAADAQLQYLRDLFLHEHSVTPGKARIDAWRSHSVSSASVEISDRLRTVRRGSDYRGPWPTDTAYGELSQSGRDWADKALVPE